MTLFLIVMLVLWVVLAYTRPWIDEYIDHDGQKHVVLWYTNFRSERKYINIVGSQS